VSDDPEEGESFDQVSKLEVGKTNSGLQYLFIMQRQPYFYVIYYVLPQIFFVFIAYCAFWIDHKQASARVALSITTILITINFTNGIYTVLPPVKHEVWLVTFSTGVLAFASISMLQYALVNFSNFHFSSYQAEIHQCMEQVKGSITDMRKRFEKEEFDELKFHKMLEEQRLIDDEKKLQQEDVRKQKAMHRHKTRDLPHIQMIKISGQVSDTSLLNQTNDDIMRAASHVVKKNDVSPGDILGDDLLFDSGNDMIQNHLLPRKKEVKKALSTTNYDNMSESNLFDNSNVDSDQAPFVPSEVGSLFSNTKEVEMDLNPALSDDWNDSRDSGNFTHNLSKTEDDNAPKASNLIQLKGHIKQEEIKVEKQVYKKKLIKHIRHLETQLAPGNNTNPFKFMYAFQEFRTFLINHWHEADYDIENKTKKSIELVIALENSATYNTY